MSQVRTQGLQMNIISLTTGFSNRRIFDSILNILENMLEAVGIMLLFSSSSESQSRETVARGADLFWTKSKLSPASWRYLFEYHSSLISIQFKLTPLTRSSAGLAASQRPGQEILSDCLDHWTTITSPANRARTSFLHFTPVHLGHALLGLRKIIFRL